MNNKITSDTIKNASHLNKLNIAIQPYHEIFYYYSILYTAECSVRAFEFYEYLLKSNADAIQLVGAVQEAIGHAGALAFYFWNNGGSSKQPHEIKDYIKNRGEYLKKEFMIDDSSPIKNRAIRNTFEHFDEKMDIFLLNTMSGLFYPMPVIQSHLSIEKEQIGKYFKLLDIDAKCLVLLNEKFFFENIQKEVTKIYEIAKTKIY